MPSARCVISPSRRPILGSKPNSNVQDGCSITPSRLMNSWTWMAPIALPPSRPGVYAHEISQARLVGPLGACRRSRVGLVGGEGAEAGVEDRELRVGGVIVVCGVVRARRGACGEAFEVDRRRCEQQLDLQLRGSAASRASGAVTFELCDGALAVRDPIDRGADSGRALAALAGGLAAGAFEHVGLRRGERRDLARGEAGVDGV